ncbi:MAG: FAA hydrolase family protein, partial [Ilumatobacteraceae bacterium]
MTCTLANIDGRAALVAGDQWYDLETVSGGEFGPDPMIALVAPDRLSALSSFLDQHEPGGALDAARLGPPVPRPRNVFAIGLNY